MSISRRELYAMGEPFGDCATERKVDGGYKCGGGGSSGGGSATSTQVADLPEWAKPYAKDTLGQAAALTDVSQNPYQTYGGQRIADFSDLQTQAQTAAGNLTAAPQMAAATGLAGAAAGQALGMQYNPYQASMMNVQAPGLQNFQMGPAQQVRTQSFTQPGAAGAYMNPYMQNVVDTQQREAIRASDILRNQQQAQAVGAGAFGGSRQAIVEAERQRNLGTQLGDIQAKGLSDAYTQAQQQFNAEQQARLAAQQANQQAGLTTGQANLQSLLNVQNLGATQGLAAQQANQQAFQNAQQLAEQSRQYGAGLGLQGLQTALTGAGQLANIGQQQFAQNQDVINLQNQMGAQQQTQEQNILSQQYQDFLNQQKYPYQQLEFMSNILRGTPMGTVTSLYGAQPTAAQNIASLGMGAYGIGQLMKAEGGTVSSYADGGSVTDDRNVESILSRLSDAQLQQAAEMAKAKNDVPKLQAIQNELAERASLRSGLGSAFNALPQQQQEGVMAAANGGIVAFAGDEDENDSETGQLIGGLEGLMAASEGNPEVYKQVTNAFPALFKYAAGAKRDTMTEEEYDAALNKSLEKYRKVAGESPYEGLSKQIADMRAEGEQGLGRAKGLAALRAADAMQQGRGLVKGLAQAGGAFGETYGQALAADRAQKRSLTNMEIQMADARRKENLGLYKEAAADAERARKSKEAAGDFGIKKANALANIAGKFASATKPTKGAGAGAPKPLKLAEQLAAAEITAANNPDDQQAQTNVKALRRAMSQSKTSDYGATRAAIESMRIASTADTADAAALKGKYTDPDWIAAYESQDAAAIAEAEDNIVRRARARRQTPGGAVNNNSSSRAPTRLQFDAQGNPIP